LFSFSDSLFFRLFDFKELFVVDVGPLEKLQSILVKLLLTNILPGFAYFLIKVGLPSLSHEQLNQVIVGRRQLLVDIFAVHLPIFELINAILI
jgi:hypothetical protein